MSQIEPRVKAALDEAYGFLTPTATVEVRRAGIDSVSRKLPEGVEIEDTTLGGVKVRWVRPVTDRTNMIVIQVHGGGFHVGGPQSHRDLSAYVALASGASVVIVDYRLCPETQFPAAFDDVKSVYRALLEQGVEPKNLAVFGDSSGGGLALASVISLKGEGVPMPAGIVTMSAWVDHTLSQDSIKSRAGWDPYQNEAAYIRVSGSYRGDVPADDPRISAMFGDVNGLPPMMMQVGTHEPLHDDTIVFAQKVRDAGGTVEVQIEEGMPHMHQMLLFNLPEAVDSANRAGAFIKSITTS